MSSQVVLQVDVPRWADLSRKQRVDIAAQAARGHTVFGGFPTSALAKWRAELCAKPEAQRTPEDRRLLAFHVTLVVTATEFFVQ